MTVLLKSVKYPVIHTYPHTILTFMPYNKDLMIINSADFVIFPETFAVKPIKLKKLCL